MATYIIGDIQGCFERLVCLLDKLQFNWNKDQLWVCGDLVNRGHQSLNTLRYLYEHRKQVQVVLGNHDLHLLAVASGLQPIKKKDTFQQLLQPQNDYLMDWLLKQPLAYFSSQYKILMVHAGVPQHWNLKQVLSASHQVEKALQNKYERCVFFQNIYGDMPAQWHKKLPTIDRLRYITNALTRMRYCYPDGSLELSCKQPPGWQPSPLVPWFQLPLKLEKDIKVCFGHWAALQGELDTHRFQALDTGCVWGGRLTAYHVEENIRISV